MDICLHSYGVEKVAVSAEGRNPFLGRWEEIFSSRRARAAVLGAGGEVLRTFGEIERCSEEWAEALGGLGFRGVVSLVAGNTPSWAEVVLGAWKAEWGVMPIEASMHEQEVRKMESLTGCRARIAEEVSNLRIQSSGADRATDVSTADLYKVTSGTSSTRRTVLFNASQLLTDADNVCDSMGIRDSDINLGLIPFAHSYGLTNLIGTLLGRGVPVVVGVDAMPRAIAAAMQAAGATVLPGVPAIFRALGVLGELPAHLRLCLSAGALLPASEARAFHAAFGLKVHSFYGASECGGICYDASDEVDVPEGYVGPPLSGVTLEERPTDAGLHAEIRGPAVGTGYLPSRPDDPLADGVFRPPDILARVPDGYRIIGRESDFINIGGRKANPLEIETALRSHPAVRDVAVFSGPEASGRGECIAACIVTTLGEGPLRAHCAGLLPAWQIPRAWFFVDTLPVNERGKLSRSALRNAFF